VIRAPASPEDIALGLPGPMLEIHDTYINLAQQKVQGIDVELRLSATPFGPGQFSMNLAATWLDRFASRTNPDEPFQEQAGTQIPRWKLNADAQWAYGPWQLRLAAHYLSAYQSTGSGDVLRRIGSFTTFDTGVTWRARWGSVALLVRNLADRDPPFFDVFSGYDAQQHDPRGRLVSLTVRGTL
jgi:iron complex outermembrane receptor protein